MSDPTWPIAPLAYPETALTDGAVMLTRIGERDVDAIVTGCSDPDTQRWLPVLPSPYGPDDAREWIATHDPQAQAGLGLQLAIRVTGDPALLGVIGVNFRGRPQEGEIGYWTAPGARGRGLTAAAVRLLASHLFATFAIGRLELFVDPANRASQRACERARTTREGLRRATWLPGDRPHTDMLVYSLVPADAGL